MNESSEAVASDTGLLANVNSRLQDLSIKGGQSSDQESGAVKKSTSGKVKNKKKTGQNPCDKPNVVVEGQRKKSKTTNERAVKVEKETFYETDRNKSHQAARQERQLSNEVVDYDVIPSFPSTVKASRTHDRAKISPSKEKVTQSCKEPTVKSVSGRKTENQWRSSKSGNVGTSDGASAKKFKKKPAKSSAGGFRFEPYIPLFEVQQGLKRGEFIEGALRINPRSYEDAYVSDPDGQMDIYIGGMRDRNRALNGDVVVVQVKPKQEWKVLCEAIKDYQERSGHNIIDPSHSPAVLSPPCKVHTPEKLAKQNLASYGSWDFPGNERLPDTLEILGVDKLARQFEEVSKEMKRKNRSKRHRQKSGSKTVSMDDDNARESGSQKSSGTSYSQGSSEDYLDKLSPGQSQQLIQTVLPERDEVNDSKNICQTNSSASPKCNGCSFGNNGSADFTTPGSSFTSKDMQDQTGKNSDFPSSDISTQARTDNPWISEESSYNLIITPDQLLDFGDGNSLQVNNSVFVADGCESDGCRSDVEGIVVAPDDLSGDDFTDTCSIGSSGSHQIEQFLEDAEFLASQQDAQNNNVDCTLNLINGDLADDIKYSCGIVAASKPVAVIEPAVIEYDGDVPAVVPQNLSFSSIISSDSLIGGGSLKECNMNEPVVLCQFQDNWKQMIETTVCKESDAVPNRVEKKKKRRSKKSRTKEKIREQGSSLNDGGTIDSSTLAIEDIMKHPLWPRFLQKTGKVVFISKRQHSRMAAGRIKPIPDSTKFSLFSPNDARLPRILIPLNDCPPGFMERPSDYEKALFIAKIIDWKEDSLFACGDLIKSLGDAGEIEPETEGILLEYGVDYSDFPDAVIQCLPQDKVWAIPENELNNRRDFRSDCVFTIDPSTARDMDDAMSCSLLENGNFEIGVHIADVSYFVEENTPLDDFARYRATSVYLVQKVIPMLPRFLCDNLCSLHPGQDKLTFSVVWEITPDCVILSEWFGRSVINSCMKMSYEHAQDMMKDPVKSWNEGEHPPIYGNFSLNDIIQRVLCLHSLAVKLRSKRFIDGALRLDQTKLQFALNNETGHPIAFSVYEQKDSNRLIEEFMLLANMSVARKIFQTFPDIALLRRHPPPLARMMEDVVTMCADMGIHLDTQSSGALQASLLRYYGEDPIAKARGMVLTHLCSKPMNCALYFCSGVLPDRELFHHYALNVPLYTHFTSPIRRYPDIIVHRLLGAALGYNIRPNLIPEDIQQCASHCNERKYSAKKVSDMSAELFLAIFIRECGSLHAQAMVINVMDHSFDCLVLHIGIVRRVYCDKLPVKEKKFSKRKGISSMKLIWQNEQVQTIIMFALVDVTLVVQPNETLKINAILNPPK